MVALAVIATLLGWMPWLILILSLLALGALFLPQEVKLYKACSDQAAPASGSISSRQ